MKKKGFIIVLILAIVAVVLTIVFINLFKERDTQKLAKNLNTAVAEGYLSDESEEYLTINEYLSSIYNKLTSSSEKSEVKNYQDSYKAYVVYGEFMNRQIVFSEYTETYKNERKKIETDLKRGQNAAEQMSSYIIENIDVTGGSDYWQANTWANCKGYMSDLFAYTSDAFNRLGDVYAASVTSPLMNNALTTLVFNTAEELSGDVSEKLIQDSSCGQTLFNFVNNYLVQSKEGVILNFNYNADQQNTVKIISEKSNGWEALYTQFLQGNIG